MIASQKAKVHYSVKENTKMHRSMYGGVHATMASLHTAATSSVATLVCATNLPVLCNSSSLHLACASR